MSEHEKCKCGSDLLGLQGQRDTVLERAFCQTCGRASRWMPGVDAAWAAWDKDRKDERRVWEAMREGCCYFDTEDGSCREARGVPLNCTFDSCPLLKEADDE